MDVVCFTESTPALITHIQVCFHPLLYILSSESFFFYFHLMLTFHCCSWELYSRNSIRLNLILKFGPYSLFSSEKDSEKMHFLPCATFVENPSNTVKYWYSF